jgi:lipopolysaccharide biosynthesis glycosyltransferase
MADSAGTLSAMESKVALVFAADEGFALPLAVTMGSALGKLHPAAVVEVCVLDNGLSESSRARLSKVVDRVRRGQEVRWLSVPAHRLAKVAVPDARFTSASYSRLLAPELVPGHIERVVYLDSDVLVRRDLSPLFTIELGDAPVAGVRDFIIPTTAHELSGVREPGQSEPYFNAGVLVIDLPRWRDAALGEHALQYAATGDALPLVDQDALNAVVTSWHELDYRWNVQEALFWGDRRPRSAFGDDLYHQRWDLYRSAAVLHFAGGPKPWDRLCTLPGTTAWVRTMTRIGWHRRLEGMGLLGRYLRSRVRYWFGTSRRRWGPRLLRRGDQSPTSGR